ncbi:hypothetical protein C8F04DRAFT_1139261 [Mycena alexandri]|uniref:F-box domain-containing protein n=1 Tax=Mycena alexandri TaxID=1745969 RepID=A0AAD6S6D0_9AGAR|nr:hypothetical protein C8F04DRAFT_1139261 [Mycena alexandri]
MSATEAPVLLGRLCSSWRAISLSTPRLWATLHVCEPSNDPALLPSFKFQTKYDQRLEAMTAWLARSGNCPLSISFQSDFVEGTPSSVSFLGAIIPFASRWQKIQLMSLAPPLVEVLSHLTENDVPILQSLAVNNMCIQDELPPSQRWTSVQILHGRRLSEISIWSTYNIAAELPVRWNILTSLTLEDFSLNPPFTSGRALEVLSRCPELQTCRFNIVDWGTGGPVVGSIVECPSLNSLHLTCSGNPAAILRRIFEFLVVAQLKHLGIQGHGNPDSDSDSDTNFPAFHAASKEFESFSIHSTVLPRQAFFAVLRSLPPTLRRLELTLSSDFAVSDGVLALLTPSEDAVVSPFCPASRELVMKHCSSSNDALMHCIKSRMSAVSYESLEQVKVWFTREMPSDILPDLRDLVDAGLRIALYYHPSRARARTQFSPWLGLEVAHPNLPGYLLYQPSEPPT